MHTLVSPLVNVRDVVIGQREIPVAGESAALGLYVTVNHSRDLLTGDSLVRSECALSDTGNYLLSLRPSDSLGVIGILRYIGKVHSEINDRRTGDLPDNLHGVGTGKLCLGREPAVLIDGHERLFDNVLYILGILSVLNVGNRRGSLGPCRVDCLVPVDIYLGYSLGQSRVGIPSGKSAAFLYRNNSGQIDLLTRESRDVSHSLAAVSLERQNRAHQNEILYSGGRDIDSPDSSRPAERETQRKKNYRSTLFHK